MPRLLASLAILVVLAMSAAHAAQGTRENDGLVRVDTPTYQVYTDLDQRQLPGVLQRLEAMADEYRRRTAGLSDRLDDRRLPFYLFASREAYLRAGGREQTAGFFDGRRLVACIGEKADAKAWSVLQHEAFHQYLAATMGRDLPMWLSEGLAEYFAEARYTGESFQSGLTPPWRLRRLRESMRAGKLPTIAELVQMSPDEWNAAMSVDYYDAAWSLVHYLAHGEGDQGQRRLMSLIRASGEGDDQLSQFESEIAPVQRVQSAWERYWLDRSEEDAWDGFAEVAVQTVCGFHARALAAGKKSDSLPALLENARQAERRDAPPVQLLEDVATWAADLGRWTLSPKRDRPWQVMLQRQDQTYYAKATMARGRLRVSSWREQRATTGPAATRRQVAR